MIVIPYRVSGERVLYDMPEAHKQPLKQRFLVTRDSYLVDRGPRDTMYMWVGANAMEDEVNNAIKRIQVGHALFTIVSFYNLENSIFTLLKVKAHVKLQSELIGQWLHHTISLMYVKLLTAVTSRFATLTTANTKIT